MTIGSRTLRVRTPIVFQPHCRRFPPSQPRFSHTRGPFILITLFLGLLILLPQSPMINSIKPQSWDFWLLKTNGLGYLEWNRNYGGNDSEGPNTTPRSIIQTIDGGFAFIGSTMPLWGYTSSNMWLIKTDFKGHLEWTQIYGGEGWVGGDSLIQTPEAGYLLLGTTTSESDSNFYLAKTNNTGQIEWEKTIGGKFDDIAYSLISTTDGGYACTGSYSSNAEKSHFWLMKIDESGNIQWNQTYGGTNQTYCIAKSFVQTNDGGFALAGHVFAQESLSEGNSDAWLVKTDANGEFQWSQIYGESGLDKWDEVYAMVQTMDGGYALAGVKGQDGGDAGDMWLVKTDTLGQLEWQKTYATDAHDEAHSMIQTTDGGYALVGRDWFVKVDAEGLLEWERRYGNPEQDQYLSSIIQTADGGYAIVGAVCNSDFNKFESGPQTSNLEVFSLLIALIILTGLERIRRGRIK